MKIELEKGNNEVKSSITIIQETERIKTILKDCDDKIYWSFYHKTKEDRIKSIIKAERAIIAFQEVQELLKNA